jgi:hypothetical protein
MVFFSFLEDDFAVCSVRLPLPLPLPLPLSLPSPSLPFPLLLFPIISPELLLQFFAGGISAAGPSAVRLGEFLGTSRRNAGLPECA